MGLIKGSYNHAFDSVIEATGYTDQTMNEELLPRAVNLGNEIVEVAGACPTMIVEIMMDSPILRDQVLDDRDKAIIVVLSGSIAAQSLFKNLVESHGAIRMPTCESKHGYNHGAKSVDQVFGVTQMEMDILNDYINSTVFSGVKKTSELIQNVEKMMSDAKLNAFQKAFVQAMVSHQMTSMAAQQVGPSVMMAGAEEGPKPGGG
jgi:hypothetical protein